MRSSPERHCEGFTLVELLGVIATTTVLMGVAVALLHSVTAWGMRTAVSATQSASLDRMEQELRRQLSEATSITTNRDTLTLTTPQGTSQWKLTEDACLLMVTHDGKEDEVRRERYRIGPRKEWKMEQDDRLAKIVLEVPSEKPGLPFRVVAPVSKPVRVEP